MKTIYKLGLYAALVLGSATLVGGCTSADKKTKPYTLKQTKIAYTNLEKTFEDGISREEASDAAKLYLRLLDVKKPKKEEKKVETKKAEKKTEAEKKLEERLSKMTLPSMRKGLVEKMRDFYQNADTEVTAYWQRQPSDVTKCADGGSKGGKKKLSTRLSGSKLVELIEAKIEKKYVNRILANVLATARDKYSSVKSKDTKFGQRFDKKDFYKKFAPVDNSLWRAILAEQGFFGASDKPASQITLAKYDAAVEQKKLREGTLGLGLIVNKGTVVEKPVKTPADKTESKPAKKPVGKK